LERFIFGELCYEYYNSFYELKIVLRGFAQVKELYNKNIIKINREKLINFEFFSDNLLNMKILRLYTKLHNYEYRQNKKLPYKQNSLFDLLLEHKHTYSALFKILHNLKYKNDLNIPIVYDFVDRKVNNKADVLSRLSGLLGLYILNKYIELNKEKLYQMINNLQFNKYSLDHVINVLELCMEHKESIFENKRWYTIYKYDYKLYIHITRTIQKFIQNNIEFIKNMTEKASNVILIKEHNLLNMITPENCNDIFLYNSNLSYFYDLLDEYIESNKQEDYSYSIKEP
jgi:hypothetical protein